MLFVRRVKVPARCNARAAGSDSRRSVLIVAVLDDGARLVRSVMEKERYRKQKRSRFAFLPALKPDRE